MRGFLAVFPVKIILPEYVSRERVWMINAYGGLTIVVDDWMWRGEAIKLAKRISENEGAVFLNQYENPSNLEAHKNGTAMEIIRDLKFKSFDYLVAGIGTGGTLIGLASTLRDFVRKEVIAVQPKEGEKIQGLKNVNEDASEILRKNIYLANTFVDVSEKDALKYTKKLWRNGYFVGYSSGAVFSVAKKLDGDVVVVFPDRGDRYIIEEKEKNNRWSSS